MQLMACFLLFLALGTASASVTCEGMSSDAYCDCEGDCTGSNFCFCPEAQACCRFSSSLGTVTCEGMSSYCDCDGDCTGSNFCSCPEAQACCGFTSSGGTSDDSSFSTSGDDSDDDGSVPIAAVVGGVVGAIVLGVGAFFFIRKSKGCQSDSADFKGEVSFNGLEQGRPQSSVVAGAQGQFRNSPGRWNFFISHVQREAGKEAANLFYELQGAQKSAWLDVKMFDKGLDAMMEGVAESDVFLLILSPTYFDREFCLKELRRAVELSKRVVLVHAPPFKPHLGDIFKKAALAGFPDMGREEAIELILDDPDHARAVVRKLHIRGGFPVPQGY